MLGTGSATVMDVAERLGFSETAKVTHHEI